MKKFATTNLAIVLAFMIIYVVWGSTYLAILFGIETIPPLLLSGIRFLTAGVILYAWCLWRNEGGMDLRSFGKNSLYGLLMLVGGTVSVTWAEQYISSSLAAIIVTTVPFWFILLDKRQWSNYFSNKGMIAGLIIGFIGVFFLTFFNDSLQSTDKPLKGQWLGILVIIAGGIAWVSGSLKAKYSPAGGSLVANAAVQLLVSGLVCLLASVFTGEAAGFHFGQVSMRSLGGMIYLIVFGSIITYISYLWLLKKRSAAQVSTYVYVNPIVAIILGAIIAGETITVVQVVALTVILAGVFIVNRTKTKGEVPVEKEKKIVTSC